MAVDCHGIKSQLAISARRYRKTFLVVWERGCMEATATMSLDSDL